MFKRGAHTDGYFMARGGRWIRWVAGVFALLAAAVSPGGAAVDLSKSVTGTVSDGSGHSMPWRMFQPPGFNTPGKKFPLVLFLHGAGERGSDNTAQVTSHIDGLFNATQSAPYASYLLAPQVPAGQQFVDVPFSTGSYTNASAPPQSTSMGLTIELVRQILSNTNIDPSRVYVTGLSMGGYGTFDILARDPGVFAAAVPMSGGGNTDTASVLKNVPLWAFHGSADTTVPVSGSRNMIAALQSAGGSPMYTELAGQGHVIWAPIYNDAPGNGSSNGQLYPWLFAQSLPEPGCLAWAALAGAWALRRRRANPRMFASRTFTP